ncbi:MAG: hypothetical protein E4H36_00830 [Spirochaetales bacterium]|nr:MAG: hypothetical protein E4H36_00830 [Spirochaetales bacterium]
MAIVTFENLMNRAQEFEQKLERYYAQIRDESKDQGVRLLTYYLARHRRHLDRALSELSAEKRAHIFKLQLKYDVDFSPEKNFKLLDKAVEDVRSALLLEAAVGYDEELIHLYKSVQSQPMSEEAHALVESLIRIEEKDVIMLKKMIAMNYF